MQLQNQSIPPLHQLHNKRKEKKQGKHNGNMKEKQIKGRLTVIGGRDVLEETARGNDVVHALLLGFGLQANQYMVCIDIGCKSKEEDGHANEVLRRGEPICGVVRHQHEGQGLCESIPQAVNEG